MSTMSWKPADTCGEGMGSDPVYPKMDSWVDFGDLRLLLDEEVAPPDPVTRALGSRITARSPCSLLDVGTGTGALALLAAKFGAHACGTDVQEKAVLLATRNSKTNGLSDRTEFRRGSLVEPFDGRRFSVIVANPPQLAIPESLRRHDWGDAMDSGGQDGTGNIRALIRAAVPQLEDGGRLIFSQFGYHPLEPTLDFLDAEGLKDWEVQTLWIPVGRVTWFAQPTGLRVVTTSGRLEHELHIIEAAR
jgi:release factor glutamine methyltransferase